jgi:glycosyltransferase involved in cell wall biosynthesis
MRPPVSDLQSIFDQVDLVVMPSRFEGLGLVGIEATIRGLPVVATSAPGLRETLPPDHPWWVRPEDPADLARGLGKAMADWARWPEVVGSAQALVRARFSLDEMRRGYREVYRRSSLQVRQ